jgi:hypothetical protein
MPFKDPDPTDPNMLVGVMLEANAEATRDMAYVLAEEFARLGYTREQLLWLFKNPFYGGAHGAYRALGQRETLSIIDECLNAWGQTRFSIADFESSIEAETDLGSASSATGEQPSSETGVQLNAAPGSSEMRAIQNPQSKIQNGGSRR